MGDAGYRVHEHIRAGRKFRPVAFLILVFWIAPGGWLAETREAPDLIFHRDLGQPLWVSAEAAYKDGEYRWELFNKYSVSNIKSELKLIREATGERRGPISRKSSDTGYLPEDLCSATTVRDHTDFSTPHRDSLKDLKRHARGIFEGKIQAITQGFLSGAPASILTVEIEETLRESDEFAAEPTLWVGYPYAAFAIGEDVFCRSEPDYAYRPARGDRVLLFPHRRPADDDHRLLVPDPVEILVEPKRGKLYFSRYLEGDDFLHQNPSLDEIEEHLDLLGELD